MDVNLCIGENYINVKNIQLTETEIIDEIRKRLHVPKDIIIKNNKAYRWEKNPAYDDFEEHTHEKPGWYVFVSSDPEYIKLVTAVNTVCKAIQET